MKVFSSTEYNTTYYSTHRIAFFSSHHLSTTLHLIIPSSTHYPSTNPTFFPTILVVFAISNSLRSNVICNFYCCAICVLYPVWRYVEPGCGLRKDAKQILFSTKRIIGIFAEEFLLFLCAKRNQYFFIIAHLKNCPSFRRIFHLESSFLF